MPYRNLIDIPPLPELPLEQQSGGPSSMRFEDLSQDGRFLLPAVLQAGGPPVWGTLFSKRSGLGAAVQQGVVPILYRLVLESGAEPLVPLSALTTVGGFQLAHAGRGDTIERLLTLMWGEIRGPGAAGATASAGELACAGRFFSESVITRPFAPPGERKVLRLEVPGLPAVPELRYPLAPLEDILALPEGAVPLEPDLCPDAAPTAFGLCHTDRNQHVNSLVYPRLFEEAALRRFGELGAPTRQLAVAAEIGFRKPFFAGERARIALRAFSIDGRFGAVGVFLEEGTAAPAGPSPPPHTYMRMLFDR